MSTSNAFWTASIKDIKTIFLLMQLVFIELDYRNCSNQVIHEIFDANRCSG